MLLLPRIFRADERRATDVVPNPVGQCVQVQENGNLRRLIPKFTVRTLLVGVMTFCALLTLLIRLGTFAADPVWNDFSLPQVEEHVKDGRTVLCVMYPFGNGRYIRYAKSVFESVEAKRLIRKHSIVLMVGDGSYHRVANNVMHAKLDRRGLPAAVLFTPSLPQGSTVFTFSEDDSDLAIEWIRSVGRF